MRAEEISPPGRLAEPGEGISAEELGARRPQPRHAAGGAALRRHPARAALPADPLRHPGRSTPATWRLAVDGLVEHAADAWTSTRCGRRRRVTARVTHGVRGQRPGPAASRGRSASPGWSRRSAPPSGPAYAAARRARARPGSTGRASRWSSPAPTTASSAASSRTTSAASRWPRPARRRPAGVRDERRAAAAAARLPAAAGRARLVRHGARQVAAPRSTVVDRAVHRVPAGRRVPAAPATPDDDGEPVTRIAPRALLVPPGFPDFMSRTRVVRPGPLIARGPGLVAAGRRSTVVRSASTAAQLGGRRPGARRGHRWAWRR